MNYVKFIAYKIYEKASSKAAKHGWNHRCGHCDFHENKYENANIMDITRATGVGTWALNNCFGNKERLGAYGNH